MKERASRLLQSCSQPIFVRPQRCIYDLQVLPPWQQRQQHDKHRSSRHCIRTVTSSTKIRGRVDRLGGRRPGDVNLEGGESERRRSRSNDEDFQAAPEIEFDSFQPRNTISGGEGEGKDGGDVNMKAAMNYALSTLRVVPASASYFTGKTVFMDSYLRVMDLARKSIMLPRVAPGDQPRVHWRNFKMYKIALGEPIRKSMFDRMINALKQMNMIHPQVLPEEIREIIDQWSTRIDSGSSQRKLVEVDELGRAIAIGRRKSSSAKAWVVEGEGEVMVNGKPLHQAFARSHDRESAIWALKITDRLDKYNVFALVNGGGTTGQAEALTLAVSKALMAHEPLLKPALRKAGCVHRDPRRVERKKPGRVKARKMPTWVKR